MQYLLLILLIAAAYFVAAFGSRWPQERPPTSTLLAGLFTCEAIIFGVLTAGALVGEHPRSVTPLCLATVGWLLSSGLCYIVAEQHEHPLSQAEVAEAGRQAQRVLDKQQGRVSTPTQESVGR